MSVTPDSPWRDLPNCPPAVYPRVLAGTPLEAHAADLRRAAGPLALLMLAQLKVESDDGDSALARATNNPLLLRPGPGQEGPWYAHPVHGPFLTFSSPVDCAVAWRRRISDPDYRDGIYARTDTLLSYLRVYAPSSDGNDPRGYAETVCWLIAQYLAMEETSMALTFGNVSHPPYLDRLIPDAFNWAWNDLGPRTVKGVVWHRQQGSNAGTEAYFSTLPPSGVCPATRDYRYGGCNGLTDYGIDNWTGEIRRWNDPTGAAHPGVSPHRAGWASGPMKPTGAYGDGRAFLADHGWDPRVVNRDQASIEIAGNFGDPIAAAAKDAIAAVTAYWADQTKVPWDAFPMIPGKNYSLVRWHDEHNGTTDCPGPVVKAETADIMARARAILKKGQTATTTPPEPAWWPDGYTPAGLTAQFGRIARRHADGHTTEGGFHPGGTISDAWVWRGMTEGLAMGELPKPVGWWTIEPAGEGPIDVVVFRRGWRLTRLSDAGGWGWAE